MMSEIMKNKLPKHTVRSAYIIDKRNEAPRNTEDRRQRELIDLQMRPTVAPAELAGVRQHETV